MDALWRDHRDVGGTTQVMLTASSEVSAMLFGLAGPPFNLGDRPDNRRPPRNGSPRQLVSAQSAGSLRP